MYPENSIHLLHPGARTLRVPNFPGVSASQERSRDLQIVGGCAATKPDVMTDAPDLDRRLIASDEAVAKRNKSAGLASD